MCTVLVHILFIIDKFCRHIFCIRIIRWDTNSFVSLYYLFYYVYILCLYNLYTIVRTSFGLNSKTGLDSGPTSPNNKFVEHGRKNSPESRKKVSVMSI